MIYSRRADKRCYVGGDERAKMEARRMKVKNVIIKTLRGWNNGEDKCDNTGKKKERSGSHLKTNYSILK